MRVLSAEDVPVDDGLTVTRWRRYGKDRLYVTVGGVRLGWHDLVTGESHIEQPDRAATCEEAVAACTADQRRRQTPAPRQPLEAMHQLPPAEGRGDRAGEQVATPADQAVAPRSVIDADAGKDLADRRAGAMARQQAAALKEAAPVRTFLARVLGVHSEERAWRVGADGEEKVAAQLAKLIGKDPRWCALHAVPVGENGADIDHLVIGPGGVFTLNAKHHPRSKVWVGGNTLMVNGQRQPYLRNSRHEAARASRLLTSACGFAVLATGGVVPVGADELTIKTAPADVHVVNRRRLVGWLRDRPEVLDQASIRALFEAARRTSTWRPRH